MHSPACTTPRKNGYSYREGLTMMAASAVGIDPYLAAEAGEDPKNALNLLRKALKTEDRQVRAELLQDAQNELRYVDAARHPELVNAISAKILAAQGRGGDSEIAHVTPGEMVLHPSQLSPRTRAMILADLASQGVTPATRTVGTGGRRNPATGAAQFSASGGCDPGLGECINDRLIPDGYKPGPPPPGVPNFTFTYGRGGDYISHSPFLAGPGFGTYSRVPTSASNSAAGGGSNDTGSDAGRTEQLPSMPPRHSEADVAAANKGIQERLDRTLGDLGSASNFDLQWAYHITQDRIQGNIWPATILEALNSAASVRFNYPNMTEFLYFNTMVTPHVKGSFAIRDEINRRIQEGTWDISPPWQVKE